MNRDTVATSNVSLQTAASPPGWPPGTRIPPTSEAAKVQSGIRPAANRGRSGVLPRLTQGSQPVATSLMNKTSQ